MWTADIGTSAKESRSQSLLEELEVLCDMLGECQEPWGPRARAHSGL